MQSFINLPPRQGFKQMDLIKVAFNKWLEVTDIAEIRKRVAKAVSVPNGATPEQKKELMELFKQRQAEQVGRNMEDIFNAAIREHPDETLELVALICCVPPEEVDEHPMREYLGTIVETLSNKEALDFFSLCMQLGRMGSQG